MKTVLKLIAPTLVCLSMSSCTHVTKDNKKLVDVVIIESVNHNTAFGIDYMIVEVVETGQRTKILGKPFGEKGDTFKLPKWKVE